MRRTAWLAVLAMMCAATTVASSTLIPLERDNVAPIELPVPPPAAGEAPPQQAATALRAKVAQLMLVTLQGFNAPDSSDKQILLNYPPGGVVIPSIVQPANVARFVEALRGLPAEAQGKVPLLIAVNLYALPMRGWSPTEYFTPLPTPMALSAIGDQEATRKLAAGMADQLTAMGINMHIGPSLSLASTLKDSKGSVYTFGSDPRFAAESAAALVSTFAEKGLVVMPSGFPGGNATRMPDKPPVLTTPASALPQQDLLPFTEALKAGAPMIHVGNARVPTVDPLSRPASLSSAVMRDLLREQLKFEGVVVAGPMDVTDIMGEYDPVEAAILALNAGADMIYWAGGGIRVMRTVEQVVRDVEKGVIDPAIIDAAYERVKALKDTHALLEKEIPEFKKATKAAEDKKMREQAYYIERRSITVVQNRNNVLPLNQADSGPVGITGPVGMKELREALEEYIKSVGMQELGTARHSDEIFDFEIERVTKMSKGARTMVCVLPSALQIRTQCNLVQALKESGPRVVAVTLGYPDAVPELAKAGADAIVCIYNEPNATSHSMRALADVLVGQAAITFFKAAGDAVTTVGKEEQFSAVELIRAPAGRLPVTLEPPFVAGYSAIYDPTFSLKKVQWDFGDGKKSKDIIAKKAFNEPGRYPVTLTVEDKVGDVISQVFYVKVE